MRLAGDEKRKADPVRLVWDLLDEPAREAVRAGKTAEPGAEAQGCGHRGAQRACCGIGCCSCSGRSWNWCTTSQRSPRIVMEFLPAKELWTPFAFHRFNRALNRLLLEAVCPRGLAGFPRPSGAATILAYRSEGETIGEMGLLQRLPRSATCVAYNHPSNDPNRTVGPVKLFRIGKALFDELLATAPGFEAKVAEVVHERQMHTRKREAPGSGDALQYSGRAEELGLVEGQKLMLIDLSRCTRCDECVKACVGTHNDGRSRLFLNGPRFDNYLVPTTCRSCLDPVCMIGCPVGSIHRGDNRQIVIEDWCIGCGQCAEQCPYGSIQMHDLGMIPATATAGSSCPRPCAGKDAGTARGWGQGRGPFAFDRTLREALVGQRGRPVRSPRLRTGCCSAASFLDARAGAAGQRVHAGGDLDGRGSADLAERQGAAHRGEGQTGQADVRGEAGARRCCGRARTW